MEQSLKSLKRLYGNVTTADTFMKVTLHLKNVLHARIHKPTLKSSKKPINTFKKSFHLLKLKKAGSDRSSFSYIIYKFLSLIEVYINGVYKVYLNLYRFFFLI